jgi:hypothetical protein
MAPDIRERIVAKDEVLLAMEINKYLKEFHPLGYGTRVESKKKEGDVWVAVMYRYASCD